MDIEYREVFSQFLSIVLVIAHTENIQNLSKTNLYIRNSCCFQNCHNFMLFFQNILIKIRGNIHI